MARLIAGTLFVNEYVPIDGTSYSFTGATYNNQSDITGSGAYDLRNGFSVIIPAYDPVMATEVPGAVWRYKLSGLNVVDANTIDGTVTWNDWKDPTDQPTNDSYAIITEDSTNLDLNFTVSRQVYSELNAGVDLEALLSQIRTIIDNLSGTAGISGYSGTPGQSGYSGMSGSGVSGYSDRKSVV